MSHGLWVADCEFEVLKEDEKTAGDRLVRMNDEGGRCKANRLPRRRSGKGIQPRSQWVLKQFRVSSFERGARNRCISRRLARNRLLRKSRFGDCFGRREDPHNNNYPVSWERANGLSSDKDRTKGPDKSGPLFYVRFSEKVIYSW